MKFGASGCLAGLLLRPRFPPHRLLYFIFLTYVAAPRPLRASFDLEPKRLYRAPKLALADVSPSPPPETAGRGLSPALPLKPSWSITANPVSFPPSSPVSSVSPPVPSRIARGLLCAVKCSISGIARTVRRSSSPWQIRRRMGVGLNSTRRSGLFWVRGTYSTSPRETYTGWRITRKRRRRSFIGLSSNLIPIDLTGARAEAEDKDEAAKTSLVVTGLD